MTGWLGGLTIHGLAPGQLPKADYLCTRCWYHARLVGREAVQYGARDLPLTHRANCPARKATP